MPFSFTQVEVTGTYVDAAGEPASGQVTFMLTQPMANGHVTVPPSPLVAELDGSGHFTILLYANDDPGTVPQHVRYGVTEVVNEGSPRDYYIAVSHSESPVDIATLMPGEGIWA